MIRFQSFRRDDDTSPMIRRTSPPAFAAVIAIACVLVGCHDPNDPNINPKAYHALIGSTEAHAWAAACSLRECYTKTLTTKVINPADGELVRKYTYELTRLPTPPKGFDIFYSPKRRVAWYQLHDEPGLLELESDKEAP